MADEHSEPGGMKVLRVCADASRRSRTVTLEKSPRQAKIWAATGTLVLRGEKINGHLGCRLRRIRLRGMAHHGVVSSPTLQRRMIRG